MANIRGGLVDTLAKFVAFFAEQIDEQGAVAHGFVVGHVTPEAFVGGPLAIVEDGDQITIDSQTKRVDVQLSDDEMDRRLRNWQRPEPRATRGLLAKYARLVSSASVGAITDAAPTEVP